LSITVGCTGLIADTTATHVVHLHHVYLNSLAILTTEDTHVYYDFPDIIFLGGVQKTAMCMSMQSHVTVWLWFGQKCCFTPLMFQSQDVFEIITVLSLYAAVC